MYVIEGHVPSKSNCYKIVNRGIHASLSKTKALEEYEDKFYLQCQQRDKMITKRFKFKLDVYFPSDRQDLDNSLKAVLDCLQMCKVIKNDRQCIEINARKFIDKNRPRIEYEIIEVN